MTYQPLIRRSIKDHAVCIILDSVKGQGVPFFEEMAANHSVKFDNEKTLAQTESILADLRERVKECG